MSAAHTIERRRSTRFRPCAATFCACLRGSEGVVWDLSATGLGMLIATPPKAALNVEMSNAAASLPVSARVVHVRKLEGGHYFVGLRFDRPLHRHEMEPFVERGDLYAA